ncbi:MAG: HAMP domain-containing protein [Planctomycetes bacterium]|nr:HAMP domain-containing protein [Planctomycetota bacterium]
MTIRSKLILVMTALLVSCAGLFVLLHLEEGARVRDGVRVFLHESLEKLKEAAGARGETRPLASVALGRSYEILDFHIALGPGGWGIILERVEGPQLAPEVFSDVPGAEFRRGESSVLEEVDPERDGTVIPDLSVLHHLDEDPISQARRESLPRQLLIAGAILLVGLAAIWWITGRMTGPLKELTVKMQQVAGGDLTTKVQPTTTDEVREMSVAFNSMVDSLREKREIEQSMFRTERLTAMGNLAAGVAHDIRNPLNTIGLTLGHLRDQYAPDDPRAREGFLRHVDDMKKELGRLNELVKNFLSLAHPDRGETVRCDLREIVEDCLRLFSKEAESKGVTIDARLEETDPLIANPRQMRGAVTNILINALQSMEPAGGRLLVSLARSGARGSGNGSEGSEILLRIADTGCGIPPDDLERVFLPYFTTRPDGTGLGLPVARAAVEAAGGRIEVRSRPAEGTEVDIIVPAAAAAAPEHLRSLEEGVS